MKTFRSNLRSAIQRSPNFHDDVWGLSTQAGLGRKTVYNTLRDERLDYSRTGPGLFGMARVADLLEVSLDSLVEPPSIRATSGTADGGTSKLSDHLQEVLSSQGVKSSLSSDSLIRMFVKSGGRIEAFTSWLARCDQYFPPSPSDKGIRVKQVGQDSLSAITMGTPDVDLLQNALDTVDGEELRKKWLADYREVCQRGSLATAESLDVQMPNTPIRVKMDFVRVLLFVSDASDERTILNFSLLVV